MPCGFVRKLLKAGPMDEDIAALSARYRCTTCIRRLPKSECEVCSTPSVLAPSRRIQRNGGTHKTLQRLFVDLVALVKVDGTPRIAFQTGIEEACRILQRRPFRKCHLHRGLIGFAGADQSD